MRTLLVPISLMLLAGGCTHVAPYQREYLAHPAMDNAAREARYHMMNAHVFEAREGAGAVGLADASGGGCGCN